MRLLVVSDTHVPDFARRLPERLLEEADRCDAVLHAGDVTSRLVLDDLSARARVLCAVGNKDAPDVAAWGAEESVVADLDGVRVAMVHDAGPSRGRTSRLRRRFPGARLIVFGHSHIPFAFEEEDILFLNPGSPTWKRRQPVPTYARVNATKGSVRYEIVELRA